MRQKHKREIESRDKYPPDVYAQLEKNSCRLYLRASQLLSREYYAEYALMQYYFTKDIHSITCEELHQSAVRFCNMIYPHEKTSKDEGEFYRLGDVFNGFEKKLNHVIILKGIYVK